MSKKFLVQDFQEDIILILDYFVRLSQRITETAIV